MGWVFGGNSVTPDEFPLDDWLMPTTFLGFLGGTTFSIVLGIADRRRRFEELSLMRFGAWGAFVGLIGGVLAVAIWQVDDGLGPILWDRAISLISSSILLSAISASSTLALARKAEVRKSHGAGENSHNTGTANSP